MLEGRALGRYAILVGVWRLGCAVGAGVGLRGVSMFLADSVPASDSKAGLLASWPRSSRG